MRREKVGEEILKCLTTPDRAPAIIGDLTERGAGAARFWREIGSNVLHAITPGVLSAAGKGFLAQLGLAILFSQITLVAFLAPGDPWRWLPALSALTILADQIVTGLWIARRGERAPLLAALLVAIADCALGVLKVNAASINMAIWSVPLLLAAACGVWLRRRERVVA